MSLFVGPGTLRITSRSAERHIVRLQVEYEDLLLEEPWVARLAVCSSRALKLVRPRRVRGHRYLAPSFLAQPTTRPLDMHRTK